MCPGKSLRRYAADGHPGQRSSAEPGNEGEAIADGLIANPVDDFDDQHGGN